MLVSLPPSALILISAPSLYLACRSICQKIRNATTHVTIRYLFHPDQLSIYPRLVSLKCYSIDLFSHSLPDYLPDTVYRIDLVNVVPTAELFRSIPKRVTHVIFKRADRLFSKSHVDDYVEGHHCEFNIRYGCIADIHDDAQEIECHDVYFRDEDITSKTSLIRLAAEVSDLGAMTPTVEDLKTHSLPDCTPPSLRHLHVGELYTNESISSVLSSHRQLVSLFISSRYEPESIPELPPSLTQLRLSHLSLKDEDMKMIAKSNVVMLEVLRIPNIESISTCRLIELTLARSTNYAWTAPLPTTLKRLRIGGLGGNTYSWPALESLSCRKMWIAPPRSLTSLTTHVSIWREYGGQAYDRLHSLTLSGRPSKMTVLTSQDFPANLTLLDMTLADRSFVYSLPNSIIHLRLVTLYEDIPYFPPPLPSNLLTLHLRCGMNINADVLRLLPSSLRELNMEGDCIDGEDVALLPPRLTRLHVTDINGSLNVLHLPHSLGVFLSDVDDDISSLKRHPAMAHLIGFDSDWTLIRTH